ncbi:beta-ketoacyl-[acyl-carrier-protein] synthase family protein, partial [bacterium]|nr:beta-ketoacyl-[acyl-carrier-protein] synthase family protein [bacterium]
MYNKRIVITGIGVVSSIGIGKDKFWENLIAGKSGVSKVSAFDTKDYPTHYGAEVKDFRPEKFLEKKQYEGMGRASQMGIAAASLAIEDAGLELQKIEGKDAGIIVGTTMGEIQNMEEMDDIIFKNGKDFVMPDMILQYPANNISCNIAAAFNLRADNLIIPCACAAGNYAIGYASDLIKIGRSKFMLAGGADPFSRIAFTGFNRLLSMAPEKCKPFDRNRQGIILGEGAGIVVLESMDSALKRGAKIYAEIAGYGMSCDAYHMTVPQFGGIASAIISALKNADIDSKDVDYINAHGTGTQANDRTECLALKKIFGDNLKKIPVSSIKSMIGHAMGAASIIEAIACAMSIVHNVIPPTISYETPDPDCDIDCVPNICRDHKVNVALNNGFAFGGNNACLVLKRC